MISQDGTQEEMNSEEISDKQMDNNERREDTAVLQSMEESDGTIKYVIITAQLLSLILEESSSEDKILEAARGTIPVCRVHGIPEKVGQLIAGLYFVAVAKSTRSMKKKEFSPQSIAVKGALVDKTNGIILCVLKIDVNGGTSVDCTYHVTGSLNPAMLCSGIQRLIEGFYVYIRPVCICIHIGSPNAEAEQDSDEQ